MNTELDLLPLAPSQKEKPTPHVMNPEQQLALDDVLAGHNVFITGGAGVGKSYLVSKIEESVPDVSITAMTGCAALLVNGSTLHSCLGIGLAKDTAQKLAADTRKKPPVVQRILSMKSLLIDEVSMLSDELFEKIHEYLCLIRVSKKNKPFAGVQLILVGDPFQLCPVEGTYCFLSKLWKEFTFRVHRLETNMRQRGDPVFKEILDRVRYGGCSVIDLDILKRLKDTEFPEGIKPTRLYSKNVSVDSINISELVDLGQPLTEYATIVVGEKAKRWASAHRIPEKVRLCVGAQVMCTKNIPELGLANGSRGVVVKLDSHGISFQKLDGERVRLEMQSVPIDNPMFGKPVNTLVYLPVKLAWAITIHSAQGMTIDALEVDLGSDIFAFGQAYTGLSRATSLSSVRIVNVLPESFVTSPKVIEFVGKAARRTETPLCLEAPRTKKIQEILEEVD